MKTFICIGVLMMICIGLVFASDEKDERLRELLFELRDRLQVREEGVTCGFGRCPPGIPCVPDGPYGPYCKRTKAAEV